MWRSILRTACVIFLIPLAAFSQSTTDSGNRKVITSRDQLPKHAYPVSGSITDIFGSDQATASLAAAVKTDIESDLAHYDIKDAKTRRDMLSTLVDIALILNQDSLALSYLPQIAALEEKPSAKALSGLVTRCILTAEQSRSDADTTAAQEAFAGLLKGALAQLDWSVIGQDVKEQKGRMEFFTPDFLKGMLEGDYGSTVEKTGEIPGDAAQTFLHYRATASRILPYKSSIISAYSGLIDQNEAARKDIWAERDVDLTGETDLKPVLIGIWDTGVDPEVYPDRMHRRPSETFDGKDDDGDGFVDDVYGIAFTWKGEPDSHVLLPLDTSGREKILGCKRYLKGIEDLTAAIDSKESQACKQKLASLKPEEVGPFMEDMMHYVIYAHGTHLAGIAIAGNPAARLTVARQTFSYKKVPEPLLENDVRRYAEDFQKTVDFFKNEGVRVACMSWGYQAAELEGYLEQNGIGADKDERAARARTMLNIMLDGMTKAMRSAPSVLFLIAAGNEDNSVDFETDMPGSINLPNVMTVGAVDFAGDETSFTAYGKSVDVYANGYMVPSKIPGGETIELSGTSMAEPQVGNLAGKLLAIDPDLSTEEVVDLIMRGAAPKEGGKVPLINPKLSIQLLRQAHHN